ncbi:MAG: hypothetical protein MK212_08565 [Saprospiraceae bacterium]|nr:hypothetical protein [Saprospiraceae bacterium]
MMLSCSDSPNIERTNIQGNLNIDTVQRDTVIPKIDDIPIKNGIQNLQELSITSQDYETVKRQIAKERSLLSSKKIDLDSVGRLFKTSLVNKIIPFWEGTTWSFEGHTSKPKEGEIACGYFVSTTLKHIGVNVNRYKLAQQGPFNEAKSLAIKSAVKEFSEDSTQENIAAIKSYLKEGIHFIGFDQNHVGFILKEEGELYLIHSNYMGTSAVEIEKIEESEVFSSFSLFFITELSTNESLLNAWKNRTPIQIIQE